MLFLENEIWHADIFNDMKEEQIYHGIRQEIFENILVAVCFMSYDDDIFALKFSYQLFQYFNFPLYFKYVHISMIVHKWLMQSCNTLFAYQNVIEM